MNYFRIPQVYAKLFPQKEFPKISKNGDRMLTISVLRNTKQRATRA